MISSQRCFSSLAWLHDEARFSLARSTSSARMLEGAGIFAGMITFLVPGWLKMKMGGPMSYLYFGGIFVVSLALIARSGKK